jgi:TetR/AcrR family transcriptional regulator, repressor for uid operon
MSVTSVRPGSLRLGSVLTRALSRSAVVGSHPTNDRIMDATLEELAGSGLADLVVEDVARRASVTRMTVYRRFGDRQRLIEATMARESGRLLAAVAAADDPAAGPVDRIVRTLTASLSVARKHPLVAHWLATNPGELLDAVLANDAAVLRAGAAYCAATIRAAKGPHPDRTGDLLVRLFAALVLMPPPSIDLDDPRDVEALARDLIAPIVVAVR